MEMNEKQNAGMQEMSPDDLEQVTGGETRSVIQKSICPICGQEITVPLATHMRGHPLVPCPECGMMMPAGPNSKCYNCGYVSSNDPVPPAVDSKKPSLSTIFLDSKC